MGLLAGVLSASCYTGANIGLRWVATTCDPATVSFVKAIPIALASSVMVLANAARGGRVWPSLPWLVRLVAAASFMQLAGNLAFQWSLGQIGLALTVPLCMGTLLIGSAVLGRVWLIEPIARRSLLSILLLIASIIVLSSIANQSAASVQQLEIDQVSFGLLAGGVGTACLSGLAYALGNVVIRKAFAEQMPVATALSIMSVTGVVLLGGLSLRHGTGTLAAIGMENLGAVAVAGVFNAVAFYSLARALQLLSVIQANLICASQVAMSVACGMIFFGEPAGTLQFCGIGLTIVGLVTMRRQAKTVSDG
ncbi:MAG: hypothetical protein CMJ62_14640 [Planctomycetaceae bacterium]|nr:hypothetical protein [Planctomycetaceae bacterium]